MKILVLLFHVTMQFQAIIFLFHFEVGFSFDQVTLNYYKNMKIFV